MLNMMSAASSGPQGPQSREQGNTALGSLQGEAGLFSNIKEGFLA